MSITVRAEQLERGCRCEVIAPHSQVPILAVITAVRDLGDIIEVDVRTKVPMRLPGQIWASNYHTCTAQRGEQIKVSHLPSESATDTGAAHDARQSRSA